MWCGRSPIPVLPKQQEMQDAAKRIDLFFWMTRPLFASSALFGIDSKGEKPL